MKHRRFSSLMHMMAALSLVAACGSFVTAYAKPDALAVQPDRVNAAPGISPSLPETTSENKELIARGRYLAISADCYACHTTDASRPYAGGTGIRTPFGTIIAPNITADIATGIGSWSDDEFYRALHHGIGKQGEYLYPAMPYDYFTRIHRDDAIAIKAYLFSLPPITQPKIANRMEFPYNMRWLLSGWNVLNLQAGELQPLPDKTDAINRGAYLATALAHCGACHTPRTISMGSDRTLPLSGGIITNGWYAPNITPDDVSGIGRWSDEELALYLKTGLALGKTSAGGPMAEAIERSLSKLSDQDIADIIAWLRDQPAIRDAVDQTANNTKAHFEWGTLRNYAVDIRQAPAAVTVGLSQQMSGAEIYYGACATCHGADGSGGNSSEFPALVGNTALGINTPNNVVLAVLNGVKRNTPDGQAFMPSFANQLSDQEIATLTNWLFANYGRPSTKTSAVEVNKLRTGTILNDAPIASIIKAVGVATIALGFIIILGWVIRFAPRIKAFFITLSRRKRKYVSLGRKKR